MYFLSKNLENAWLIGVFDNIVYAIKDTDKGLCIYQKHVYEIEKWELFCQLKIHLSYICPHCKNNLPIAAGIHNSKLWILATGYVKDQTRITPQVFCVNFKTKKICRFKTIEKELNNTIKRMCIRCKCSKITFEENLNNKSIRFLVESNRVKAYPTKPGMRDYPDFPILVLFNFVINEKKNVCEFGETYDYMPIFSIFSAGFICSEDKLGLFIMARNLGFRIIDEQKYILSTFDKISDTDIIEFWRNENNHLYCYIERNATIDGKNRIIEVYQIDINNMENSASLNHKASFSVGLNFPSVEKSLIFSTSNLFIFQINDGIVTAVNKMLSLFEIAYFTIVNIHDNLDSKKKCWISMEFFYKYLKVPRQIKYPCRIYL